MEFEQRLAKEKEGMLEKEKQLKINRLVQEVSETEREDLEESEKVQHWVERLCQTRLEQISSVENESPELASGRPAASSSATSVRRFAGGLQLHTTDLDDINLDEVEKHVAPLPPPPPPLTVTPVSSAHPLPVLNVPLSKGPVLTVSPASQVVRNTSHVGKVSAVSSSPLQFAPSPPTQRHPGVPIISKPVMLHPDPNLMVRPTIKSEALPQEMFKRMVVYNSSFRSNKKQVK
ncbi:harmonin-like [Centrocercus urophasianus]|uniref:harmonin-like n=1 Tax=Centrocercus urophasianus TaxID=9002 RepID=UPI001C64AE3E|nr:harmonin-like [Centrocercus urophasianus]